VADAYADGTLDAEKQYLQIPVLRDLGTDIRRGVHDGRAFTLGDLDRAKRCYGADVIDHLHLSSVQGGDCAEVARMPRRV
jgi:hypothetical protein